MSDEITAARKKKRRKYNIKRTARFMGALALVLVAVIAANTFTSTTVSDVGDFFHTLFAASSGWPAALGEAEPLQIERMSSAFAAVTESELIVISRRGARLLDENHGFIAPFMAAAGNRVALCNRGSRDVRVYNRSALVASFSTDGAIIDAAMAGDGTLAVLSESEHFTCELSVYKNGLYERSMTWKSAYGFPLLAAVSPDGSRAAAATVSVAGGALDTTVTVIDTAREKEQESVTLSGTLMRLILSNDGGFIAVTDSAAYKINSSGEETTRYSFEGRPLLAVAYDSRLALAFGDNSRAAVNSCVVLGKNLEEATAISDCGAVRALNLSGDRVLVLGNGRLTIYNSAGERIKVYNTDIKAINIVEFSSIIEILPDRAQKAEEFAPQPDGEQAAPSAA